MSHVVGVDGCRIGWVAATHDLATDQCQITVHPSFAELVTALSTAEVFAVDIPIGLSDRGSRPADQAARRFLGPRASSVFPAPCRAALAGTSYPDASARSFALTGKKLSKQTYFIIPKIREVDAALASDPALATRVVEVHPEVSFATLNDDQPLTHAKKGTPGREERLALLPRRYQAAYGSAWPQWPRAEVAHDDLLDALVAAWTARRILSGDARAFPPPPTVHDAMGLPMRILA